MNINAHPCLQVNARKNAAKQPVVVVSGLPRSGTSMMMMMLKNAGLSLHIDGQRKQDIHNPNGYFETEETKDISCYTELFTGLETDVVKVISRFLPSLPATRNYRILFMRRPMDAVLKSQSLMAEDVSGEVRTEKDNQVLANVYHKHLEEILSFCSKRPNIDLLEVDYNGVLSSPQRWIETISEFIQLPLNKNEMLSAIQTKLNRNG
ncbi:MAG: sulfotransferase [Aestuariibacter sp.]